MGQPDIFNESNVMFSLDGTNFVSAADIDPIYIDTGTTKDLFVRLNVPIGTSSRQFSGIITYSVMENLS